VLDPPAAGGIRAWLDGGWGIHAAGPRRRRAGRYPPDGLTGVGSGSPGVHTAPTPRFGETGRMSVSPERAARIVADAVLAHARAVAGAEPARQEAASALSRALADYGEAVADAGWEPPEGLDELDAYLDGDEDPEEAEPPAEGERLALFVRADFTVTDRARLRAAGVREFLACCGNGPDSPEDVIRTAADALENLVGHGPLADLPGLADAGVTPLAETVAVRRVDWTMDDPNTIGLDPWAPLRDRATDDGP
jgi:hypothetical protein